MGPVRSWLFTPGNRPDRFANAGRAGADVSILDLEDAVPRDDKATARSAVLEFLSSPPPDGQRSALRINGLDTRDGIGDIHALLGSHAVPDFLVLPKTESAGHLHILDRLLTAVGCGTRLIAIVESARGLAAVEEIATATPRLAGLMLGAADMAADLGIATAWAPLAHARSSMVLACTLAGVMPVDSPFFDLRDPEGLASEATDAAAFGFHAKAAIHPNQVRTINEAFTPSQEDVEHARAVLAANAMGVGIVNDRMIDEAVARKARRVLAAAGQ